MQYADVPVSIDPLKHTGDHFIESQTFHFGKPLSGSTLVTEMPGFFWTNQFVTNVVIYSNSMPNTGIDLTPAHTTRTVPETRGLGVLLTR